MIVLAYHKINNQIQFEKQIDYLIRHYEIVDNLDQKRLFKKKIVLTFDDGDPSFYYKAFPILKKYEIPAILFVITDLIDSNKPFWWDEIEYYLGNEKGNKKVWEVKEWPNSKREAYLKMLRNESDKPKFRQKQLTVNQLREMQLGGVIIANHSHSHPMFDKCTESELENELKKSSEKLNNLGFTFNLFAYPNGNFSVEAENKLRKFGINIAFLFDHKIHKKNNPLRISRLIVNDSTSIWKLKFILSGWHTRVLPFSRALAKLR